MIHWIHGDTTNCRSDTAPAFGTGFTQFFKVVLGVGYFTDRGATACRDFAHFTRPQPQGRILAFTRNQLNGSTGTSRDLSTFTWFHLYAVHNRTDRNIAQWQAVTRFDSSIPATLDSITGPQALGRNNISALAVGVQHQRDMRRAVRIMFYALNAAIDTVLVALEVDNTIVFLMTSTAVTRRYATGVVSATCA
jgi:hypothetical protein